MQQVKAKKHLGQHFLKDESIAKKIAESMLSQNSSLPLLEIGPGMGVLTKYLFEEKKLDFYALDIDMESVDYLKKNYPNEAHKIIYADFLEVDCNKLFKAEFNLIGNFPYNISSQIMFRVLELRSKVNIVVGMFQKEVAERMAEKPGSKKYGILSVLLQAYFDIEYLFTVNEQVFDPPPKVKSAVVRFTRNKVEKLNCNEELFFKVVKTAFNQRRKMMRNPLKPFFTGNEFIQHEIFNKRAEQLSVEDFVFITNNVKQDN